MYREGAGGDDRGPPGKAGGPGSGPRIGYSGQGYYNSQPHHAQYKVVNSPFFHPLLYRCMIALIAQGSSMWRLVPCTCRRYTRKHYMSEI